MYRYEYKEIVRYADTDQMGFVYYGNYARFYEIGRTEALRSLGFPYGELEKTGIWLPIVAMEARYLKPAFYDDTLTIVSIVKEIPNRKIVFDTQIYNQHNVLINEAKTTLVFLDAKTQKVTHIPEEILAKMRPYFDGAD